MRRLQANSNAVSSLLACTCERTTLNSETRIVVGSSTCDKVTTVYSINKLDVLDCNATVVLCVRQRRYSDCTSHCLAITINSVVKACLLCESYVLFNVSHENDFLTVLYCIDSSLKRSIFYFTNLGNGNIVTIYTILRKSSIVESYSNLTGCSCRHCAISLVLGCTDSTPDSVLVSGSHSVLSTVEYNIIVTCCFASNNWDECLDLGIFDSQCSINRSINANTITNTICELYVFKSCICRSTE